MKLVRSSSVFRSVSPRYHSGKHFGQILNRKDRNFAEHRYVSDKPPPCGLDCSDRYLILIRNL